jgi:hypothetical protein
VRRLAVLLFLVGCYQEHSFRDCELSCTDELGCPSGLSCLAGMCRASGATGDCTAPGGDGAIDTPPGDLDGDGVADEMDNCPDTRNTDQADEDLDRIGDACDICPIGPTPAENADSDHDGVGDGCDPDNTTTDRILLFEPFNSDTLPGAMAFGTNQPSVADGVAQIISDDGSNAGLSWDFSGTTYKVWTKLTTKSEFAPPEFAGTVDLTNVTGVVGIACTNYANAAAGNNFFAAINATDASYTTTSVASSSMFDLGQSYVIAESRVNGTVKCTRDDGPSAAYSGSIPSNGTRVGIIARSASATFDYVLIVGH